MSSLLATTMLLLLLAGSRGYFFHIHRSFVARRELTFLYAASSSSSAAGSSNEGVKVLHSSDDGTLALLWKTGNVYPYQADDKEPKKRRASVAIDRWLESQRGSPVATVPRPKLHTPIGASESGLVLVTSASLSLPPLRTTYHAVVTGKIADSSAEETAKSGMDMALRTLTHVQSGSYPAEGLSLISIETPFQQPLASIYARLGDTIYRDGPSKVPFLSLVDMVCAEPQRERSLVSEFLACLHTPALGPLLPCPTPAKFAKLLKREELLYNRLRDSEQVQGEREDEQAATQHVFRGLSLEVPSAGLVPRASSGVLVEAALKYSLLHARDMSDNGAPPLVSALDLGCGSGALLLAFLNEVGQNVGGGLDSGVEAGPCLGLDLDEEALSCARLNAAALDHCAPLAHFLNHSFDSIHLLDSEQSESSYSRGFSVVMCNPPFLSTRQAKGRVTQEAQLALVSGDEGTECYVSICRSLAQCSTRLILPRAVVIFQLPAGDGAAQKVWASIRDGGKGGRSIAKVEVVEDERGVKRCLVLRLDG